MKNRYTILYFAVALIAGIIVACSGESAEKQTQDIVAEPGEDTTSREKGYFERTEKHPFDNRLLNAYKLAKKNGKYVSYFVNTYSGTFFLIQNREQKFNKQEKLYNNLRFGLIDGKGKRLLPTEYDRIGNPGFIADDYMEIRKNGKYGLYNYAENKLFEPEFDALYPSAIMEYVAIGQKGNTFYKIYPDGKNKPFSANQSAPGYTRLLKDYRFNIESEYFGLWISTYEMDTPAETDYSYSYSSAMILTPSYLLRLGIFPEIEDYLSMDWSEFGTDSLDVSLVDGKKRSENTYSMLTSFYSYTADARGYESQQRYLVTLDSKNTVKSKRKLLDFDNYLFQNSCSNGAAQPKVRFVNDSIVEVKNYKENKSEAIPYLLFTHYSYYLISTEGNVQELGSGIFPMTAAIELNRGHFKGCFARMIVGEDVMNSPSYDEDLFDTPMYAYTDHLSAADLEYMRNEILARHGMKFKDERWNAIFRSYKWYKPKRTKVDGLLSPVEKKNLELIRILEKELQQLPESLIHEEHSYMVVAG